MDESDENESSDENQDEEEENEAGQVPLLVSGPQQVKVDNSQGLQIGNTVNVSTVNFSVKNIVMRNEDSSQMLQGCPANLPGLLMNYLLNVPSSQTETNKIGNPRNEAHSTRSVILKEDNLNSSIRADLDRLALVGCSTDESIREAAGSVFGKEEECGAAHNENNKIENTVLLTDLENDLPNNEHSLNEVYDSFDLKKQYIDKMENVSVDLIIKDFMKDVNELLNQSEENEFDVSSISEDLDVGVLKQFRLKLRSNDGKLVGFRPLILEEGPDIDLRDHLLTFSVALKLEHLQLRFDDFSIGWEDIGMKSKLKIAIVENSILLTLSNILNEQGYSENNVSLEFKLERIEVDVDSGTVANEVMVKLAKQKIKQLFFENYSDKIVDCLCNLYTDNVKCILQYNDICAKLASIYM